MSAVQLKECNAIHFFLGDLFSSDQVSHTKVSPKPHRLSLDIAFEYRGP